MSRDESGNFLKSALRLLCAVALLAPSSAAQILVTNDNASGAGSLSAAVASAAGTPGSLIEFSGANGNVAAGSELFVSNDPTISAAGTSAFSIPDLISIAGNLTLDTGGATGSASGAMGDASETVSGSLTIKDSAGGGALTLSGANSYSGGTSITATAGLGVTVFAGAANTLGGGALTMTGGGARANLDLQNFNQTIGSLTGDSGSTLELGSGVLTIDQTANTSFSGVISDNGTANPLDGSGGALVKNGSGTLILNASAFSLSNTYSGGTTINAGVLGVAADGDLGSLSGGVAFNGGTLQAAGTAGLTSGRAITLLSGGGTFDTNGQSSFLSGVISGSGGLAVADSSGNGVLTLTNTLNSYSGGTTLTAGTLAVFGDGALGAAAGGIAFNGGTLEAGGSSGLQSGRQITLLVGGGTFNTNGLGSTLTGVLSGGGTLTVEDGVGGGILSLANAANTYSGGTVLDGGTLSVATDADLGSTIGGVTFNGGTLQAAGSLNSARSIVIQSGGGVFDANGQASVLIGSLSGVGGLTVADGAGGGTLTLANAGNSYSGGTTLNSGTLIVSADGDLGAASGLLTFNGGTLQAGGTAGLATARSIFLTGSGGTFNANGLNSTFSGVIGGVGGLTLEDTAGGGSLALTNAGNTYAGGTAINSGTLVVAQDAELGDVSGGVTFNGGTLQAAAGGGGLSTARAIALQGNGTFDANGTQSALGGTISGGGGLTFVDSAGGGVVEVSGTNSYAGGTVINGANVAITNSQALSSGFVDFVGGTLQAAASGLTVGNQLVLGGTGTVDAHANDVVLTGAISGASALILTDSLNGNGQITLQGANTATGGTEINGTVTVAANAANALGGGALVMTSGTGNATLNIGADQTIGSLTGDANSAITLLNSNLAVGSGGVDTVYAGSLVDDGGSTLTKNGAATLTLSGPWSVATTAVNGGVLALGANATDSGAITVNSGAAFDLNGFNQSGGGALVNNGTVATGSGVLTAGSYSGNGTLAVNVLSSGANLRVTGSAALTGQTLQIEGHPASGDYTIVTAGSLTGEFAACDVPGGYTCIQSNAVAGSLMLELFAGTYSAAGQSANQAAIATAFNQAVPVATGDLSTVLTALSNLSGSQLNQALDQSGPVSIAAMSGISYASAGLQSAALGQRMSGLQGGDLDSDGAPLSFFTVNGPVPSRGLLADGIGDSSPWDLMADTSSLADAPLGFFASAVDATGRLNSISGAAGSQPGYTFGSAGGLVGADYRLDDQTAAGVFLGYIDGSASIAGGGAVDVDSARGGAYLTARRAGFRTDASAGAAYDLFSTSRDVAWLSRTATASPKGAELNFDVQTSYDLAAGSWLVAPFVGASYDSLTVSAYSESGAGSMDLSVARQTAQSARSDLGARVSRRFALGGLAATPFASVGWGHEFADQSRAIQAELAGGAGGPFSVQTADASRDAALLAAGFDVGGRGGWDVRLAYAGDVRADFMENSFSGSVRVKFEAPDWIP